MDKIGIIKKTSALLLAISFFLPLSIMKCGAKVIMEDEPAIVGFDEETIKKNLPDQTIKPKDEAIDADIYFIPYKDIEPNEPATLLILLTFMWPIPILLLNYYGRSAKVISIFKIFEPIGCLGSSYVIICATFILGDALFAGYMATASIACYFVVSCFDAGLVIRDFIINWRTKSFS